MAAAQLKRSLNISFLDDPYLAVLAKRLYLKNIKGEVDELNIQVNGRNEEMVNFIASLWENEATKIIKRIGVPKTINHGEALNELYKISTGNIFIILDSDNFIYQKGVINECCRQIETHYDFVVSKGPYMAFFRKIILDRLNVDFRETHEGGKFHDTMKKILYQLDPKRTYIIPVDNMPTYEHIGRMSAFGMYAQECYMDVDTGLGKYVRKLFGRANRVALIKHIYNITKNDVPFPKFNEAYWKTFCEVCEEVGHKLVNINKILEENIRPKFKDYER